MKRSLRRVADDFRRPLDHDVLTRTAYSENKSWNVPLKRATIIRAHLFAELVGAGTTDNKIRSKLSDPIWCNSKVQSLRFDFGYRIPESSDVLDYGFTRFLGGGIMAIAALL